MEPSPVFLVFCKPCGRQHRMTMQPCPECQGRGGDIPMPVSDRVANVCKSLDYRCDGCDAYRNRY